jgi:hypothetical protein
VALLVLVPVLVLRKELSSFGITWLVVPAALGLISFVLLPVLPASVLLAALFPGALSLALPAVPSPPALLPSALPVLALLLLPLLLSPLLLPALLSSSLLVRCLTACLTALPFLDVPALHSLLTLLLAGLPLLTVACVLLPSLLSAVLLAPPTAGLVWLSSLLLSSLLLSPLMLSPLMLVLLLPTLHSAPTLPTDSALAANEPAGLGVPLLTPCRVSTAATPAFLPAELLPTLSGLLAPLLAAHALLWSLLMLLAHESAGLWVTLSTARGLTAALAFPGRTALVGLLTGLSLLAVTTLTESTLLLSSLALSALSLAGPTVLSPGAALLTGRSELTTPTLHLVVRLRLPLRLLSFLPVPGLSVLLAGLSLLTELLSPSASSLGSSVSSLPRSLLAQHASQLVWSEPTLGI